MNFPGLIRRTLLRFLGLVVLSGSALSGPASESIQLLLPKHRLHADDLAVIVNDADPLSVRIGDYYQKARGLPSRNILHVHFAADRPSITEKEFREIKTLVDRITPPHIQAYALTWATPFRVECMSITSAFSFGFDKAFCSRQRCAATRHSPYFNHPGAEPYTQLGLRPSISIAAADFEQAKKLIDTGIRSDETGPAGTAYLVSTDDKARNVRSIGYPDIERRMSGWIETEIVETNGLRNANDILFYFTGKAEIPYLETLRFVPGAIADHLTSAGGRLTGSRQMSALRWLEAGATGSFGTVREPCNVLGKFPNPALVMEFYGAGRTLLEAYWKSVQQPGEGIFIGEPLAAPFDGYRLEVRENQVLLNTRVLLPGLYQLSIAQTPVGPYQSVPGLLKAAYHQREFVLPKLDASYYKLEQVETTRRSSSRAKRGGSQ